MLLESNIKNRLLKTATKAKNKKKILIEESKSAKSPLVVTQDQKQNNIILFNSSYFDPNKG